jgi:hypothetical protein
MLSEQKQLLAQLARLAHHREGALEDLCDSSYYTIHKNLK